MVKKIICIAIVLCFLTSCSIGGKDEDKNNSGSSVAENIYDKNKPDFSPEILPEEKASIKVGDLSKEHEFYKEIEGIDKDSVNYVKEISIYDKEINDTFIVHISLPPNYTKDKKFPMVVMTDGVWRLSDHPEQRQHMKNGEYEEVILVSIGYPNGYDYRTIRERDLVEHPDYYLHFIVDNLMPYLEQQYSVDTNRLTLTGHSYGGYWAFYALFNSDTIGKNTFKNYYIGSPSFQAYTNEFGFIDEFEEKYYSRTKALDCNVYITVGAKEESGFIQPITEFVDFLKERNYDDLTVKYEIIENYDHNTVFKPSITNALKLFYGK